MENARLVDGGPRVPPLGGGPEDDRVVEIARSYVGTPWRHQGRDRKGLDCVGLLYRVWCDLGLDPSVDGTGYGHVSDGRWLRETVNRLLVRAARPLPGAVLLMAQRGMHPLHVGIVSALRVAGAQPAARGPRFRGDERGEVAAIIHANARARGVVEQEFVPALGLRPVAYYQFPEGSRNGGGGLRVPRGARPRG